MKLLPDTRYIYKKENGIIYNLIYYAKLNYPYIIILSICFGLIFAFSKNKYAAVLTIILVSLNSYLLHRYAPILLGAYNPHKYHHDSKTANTWWGRIVELLTNISISSNYSLLVFNYLFNKIIFDPYVMIFYCLLYTTTHLYTYHVYDIQTHKLHHLDEQYNFGPDVLDIICETKYEGGEIENNNLFIPNLFLSTIVVICLYAYNGYFLKN
jgi:hypothetical protein